MIQPKVIETKVSRDFFDVYKQLRNKQCFFLDSSLDASNLCEYSFIGLEPFLVFKYENNCCSINNKIYNEDPYDLLKKIIKRYQCINETELPFIGGGIGYFTYDLIRNYEKLPELTKENIILPDCYFVFYDNILIFRHSDKKIFISALGIKEDKNKSINQILKKLNTKNQKVNTENKLLKNITKTMPVSDFTQYSYETTIQKVKDYIRDGDIYITNLTQTFKYRTVQNGFDIYKKLRTVNPAPFSAYLEVEGTSIICSSPERFLKIKNNKVETRPIKGTRPRGKNIEEDEILKNELLNSEKDKSELLMIVDLERNDLSKVCKPHSVKVTELFKIEEYETVFHLVSTVEGVLKDDKTSIDCVKACFPGGSITGAPKIRSMEIIEELEAVKRNIYTGCIGYIGFDGNIDLNIVIRTIVLKDNTAYMGVGGGITWESNCTEEYLETLQKAKALFQSIMNNDIIR